MYPSVGEYSELSAHMTSSTTQENKHIKQISISVFTHTHICKVYTTYKQIYNDIYLPSSR